jgi:hypothetical protein
MSISVVIACFISSSPTCHLFDTVIMVVRCRRMVDDLISWVLSVVGLLQFGEIKFRRQAQVILRLRTLRSRGWQ